ncbi:DUF2313 domain-containing protein [Bradyrhizobium sp. CCGUVB1N3]|uniref:YmfQ family protein n=1 Tax=Bradyrhizobium sp. CCGUVB1N3 TaxID=2949629 RepID=UPI0020B2FE63|nr:putative phage tail protein [Bradyrhizobium sp. CCGUVB1N3]MCP3475157.1 DUF2313 domain-containing protein [Bradyrhizobium sp. CCGUVB1N3]
MSDRHIRRAGSDYRDAFLELLPNGQAWPKHSIDSVLWQACDGLCDYWGFVDGRAADLLETESDPRLTLELLPDWERNWGLPDECLKDPPTSLADRRAALLAKMTLLGAQSRQFMIEVAKAYGYDITITEYAPYMTGVSRVGDTRWYNEGDPDHYRWYLGPPEMRFFWTVHVNATKMTRFHVNSSQCGIDRLLKIWLADDLECILDKIKPAQTNIIYDYSPMDSLDFSQRYNTEYLALGIM